jgi:hypothetical protein
MGYERVYDKKRRRWVFRIVETIAELLLRSFQPDPPNRTVCKTGDNSQIPDVDLLDPMSRLAKPKPPIGTVYTTGETNPVSGVFEWSGYVDDTWEPVPSQDARRIPLTEGNPFPPMAGVQKACRWRLVEYA